MVPRGDMPSRVADGLVLQIGRLMGQPDLKRILARLFFENDGPRPVILAGS